MACPRWGLQRVLGFGSYETAWAWLQKLRRAMVRPDRDLLSGVVELDEVFVGNESRGAAGGMKDNTRGDGRGRVPERPATRTGPSGSGRGRQIIEPGGLRHA